MRTAFRAIAAVGLLLALSGCIVYPYYPYYPRYHYYYPYRYYYGP